MQLDFRLYSKVIGLLLFSAVWAWGFTDPPLLDNFNRADQGPPPSANWTSKIHSAHASGLCVVSNVLRRCPPTPGFGSAWWNVTTFGPDTAASFSVPDAVAASGNYVEVYVRGQSFGTSTPDAYGCHFEPDTNLVWLVRLDNNVGTTLSATVGFDVQSGDQIGCEMIGTTLTAYVNQGSGWVAVVSANDSTYAAAGHVGISTGWTAYSFDDFRAETVTAGGVPRRGVPLMAE